MALRARRAPGVAVGEWVAYLHWLAHEIAGVVRANRFWMTWNLLLAGLPAALALGLFARPHRRTILWWIGVCVFALFLA